MAELVAQFTSSIRSGVAPLTVNFSNTSTGSFSTVRWDFGDGSSSSDFHPSHQYLSDGVYQVRLTIFDSANQSADYSSTISVFPSDNYSTSSTTQQALFATKRFVDGQVSVRKTTIDGSTVATLYPMTSSSLYSSDLSKFSTMRIYSGNSDTNCIGVVTEYALISSIFDAGYDVYVSMFMTTGGSATIATFGNKQYQTYKVTGHSANLLYMDRPVFNIKGSNQTFNGCYFTTSGGSLSANSPIQTLQMMETIDTLESLDGYLDLHDVNTRGSGTFNYFIGNSSDGETRVFLSPTYSGWSSVESWKPGSVRVYLPFVLWHEKSTYGISLIDSTETYRDAETNLIYSNLEIEGVGTIVGKVFHDKKILMIEDGELQTTMIGISNRNWSLPAPTVASSSVPDSSGLGFDSGVTYFVTYVPYENIGLESYVLGGFGVRNVPVACRYYQKVTPQTSGNKLSISVPNFGYWETDSRTSSANSGFLSNNVYVIVGSATTENIGDATDWFGVNFVGSSSVDQLRSGTTISNPSTKTFTSQIYSGSSDFNFGGNPTILGYFSATSQSTIYRMSATCVAKNNEFNTTQNETFDESVNESVYITEVALYNEQNELLMTGKLNTPVEKNEKKFVTIKMDLDL